MRVRATPGTTGQVTGHKGLYSLFSKLRTYELFPLVNGLAVQRSTGPSRHRIWPGEGSTVQWKWSPLTPGSLKAPLFPPLANRAQNKGTRGVQARYGTELPPFISIVRCSGRPVRLGMDLQKVYVLKVLVPFSFANVGGDPQNTVIQN